jgi:hypothetical protein
MACAIRRSDIIGWRAVPGLFRGVQGSIMMYVNKGWPTKIAEAVSYDRRTTRNDKRGGRMKAQGREYKKVIEAEKLKFEGQLRCKVIGAMGHRNPKCRAFILKK